jgi:hypothetical protein
MCQDLLVFLTNDNCSLSNASIITSSASDVHFPCCVKLGTLFTLVSFFAYARIVGGMLSLSVVC